MEYKDYYGAQYYDKFDAGIEKSLIKDHLLSLPWQTRRSARHECFLSDLALSYSYGGRIGTEEYKTEPLTLLLKEITNKLNSFLNTDFNAIFLNKYDDERQHLGWHADDFAGMKQDQPIAVISFGAEREIWVKDKRGFKCVECDSTTPGKVKSAESKFINCAFCDGTNFIKSPPNNKQPLDQRILLKEGSLFVMPVGYQDTHFHRIPKHDRPCGWRISLTFRSFYPQ